MGRRGRIALGTFGALLLFLIVLPLLVPRPALRDTVPPYALAFPDSSFVNVRGVDLHYRETGSAFAPSTIILLHGFGASTFSWRDQLPLLQDRSRVIAFDRPAFGLSERPMPGSWDGPSPYSMDENVEQVVGLMDALEIERAVLVGHSAGGAVALMTAARHPERVAGLVLEAPAILEVRTLPSFVSALLSSAQARRVGPLLVRRIGGPGSDSLVTGAYARSELVTDGVLAGYRLPLRADDWDRGLWELIAAPRRADPSTFIEQVRAPTLVIAGDADTFVDPDNAKRVFERIHASQSADADSEVYVEPRFVLMTGTGHLPHEEEPERFATEVFRFLDTLPEQCDV